MRHAGTAPWSWPHGMNRDHGLIFSECHPCSRLTLLPMFPVAHTKANLSEINRIFRLLMPFSEPSNQHNSIGWRVEHSRGIS